MCFHCTESQNKRLRNTKADELESKNVLKRTKPAHQQATTR